MRIMFDTNILIHYIRQTNHPTLPSTFSPRNMGKNDLWIASAATVLKATLLTTDKDFDHLDKAFLDLQRLEVL